MRGGAFAFHWLTLAILLAPLHAEAHSPILHFSASWTAPSGRTYGIGFLEGDGIIAANPMRPAVIDNSGKVVALGPLAYNGYVDCSSPTDCLIYLGGGVAMAARPNEVEFRAPRSPDFYPESEEQEYGFVNQRLSVVGLLRYYTASVRHSPLLSACLGLIFFLAGFVAMVGTKASLRKTREQNTSLSKNVLRVSGASALWLLSILPLFLIWTIYQWLGGTPLSHLPALAGILFGGVVSWRTQGSTA